MMLILSNVKDKRPICQICSSNNHLKVSIICDLKWHTNSKLLSNAKITWQMIIWRKKRDWPQWWINVAIWLVDFWKLFYEHCSFDSSNKIIYSATGILQKYITELTFRMNIAANILFGRNSRFQTDEQILPLFLKSGLSDVTFATREKSFLSVCSRDDSYLSDICTLKKNWPKEWTQMFILFFIWSGTLLTFK